MARRTLQAAGRYSLQVEIPIGLDQQHPGQRVRCIGESRPGKSHALNTGLAAVGTELVISLDADTLLPPRASVRSWLVC